MKKLTIINDTVFFNIKIKVIDKTYYEMIFIN